MFSRENFFSAKRSVNLNVGSKCTLACTKCHREWFKERGIPIRGDNTTVQEMEILIDHFPEVVFCGSVSDPIVHPKFIEFLRMLHESGTITRVTTAVSHRNEKWFREAFEANPDAIWSFSIDGLPKDSHKYRVNQDGEKLFQMMVLANQILNTRAIWKYIVFSYNEDDVDEAVELTELELDRSADPALAGEATAGLDNLESVVHGSLVVVGHFKDDQVVEEGAHDETPWVVVSLEVRAARAISTRWTSSRVSMLTIGPSMTTAALLAPRIVP